MVSDYPLTEQLLRVAGIERAGDPTTFAQLERRLSEGLGEAHSAFGELGIPSTVWLRHVASVLPEHGPLLDAVQQLHLDELWLCAGCLQGDERFMAVFERTYMPKTRGLLGKLGIEESLRDELIQELRSALLVPKPTRAAKLASYSGRGSLSAWLKVVITRAALRRKRRASPQRRADSLLVEQLGDGTDDAELEQIRTKYKQDFEQAVEWAFRQLRSDQRTPPDGRRVARGCGHHRRRHAGRSLRTGRNPGRGTEVVAACGRSSTGRDGSPGGASTRRSGAGMWGSGRSSRSAVVALRGSSSVGRVSTTKGSPRSRGVRIVGSRIR